jgi:hypothetical protein
MNLSLMGLEDLNWNELVQGSFELWAFMITAVKLWNPQCKFLDQLHNSQLLKDPEQLFNYFRVVFMIRYRFL